MGGTGEKEDRFYLESIDDHWCRIGICTHSLRSWLAMVYILWRFPLVDGRCLVHEDRLRLYVFDILVYLDRGYRDHIRRLEAL